MNLIYFFSSTNYIKSGTCLLTITQCLFNVYIYILYIDFDHKRNNSYFNFEEQKYIILVINTAGPILVSIFGNTRDHMNTLVKTISYDIYFYRFH